MKKILLIISVLIIIYLLYLINSMFGGRSIEKEIHYLPNNYIGRVFVIFKKKGGNKKESLGHSRLYRIPESGILVTKFNKNLGWIESSNDLKFYYVDSLGNPIKSIPYIYKVTSDSIISRQDVGVPYVSYRNVKVEDETISYLTYVVDTLQLTLTKYETEPSPSSIVEEYIRR